jgi:hypothetical protein
MCKRGAKQGSSLAGCSDDPSGAPSFCGGPGDPEHSRYISRGRHASLRRGSSRHLPEISEGFGVIACKWTFAATSPLWRRTWRVDGRSPFCGRAIQAARALTSIAVHYVGLEAPTYSRHPCPDPFLLTADRSARVSDPTVDAFHLRSGDLLIGVADNSRATLSVEEPIENPKINERHIAPKPYIERADKRVVLLMHGMNSLGVRRMDANIQRCRRDGLRRTDPMHASRRIRPSRQPRSIGNNEIRGLAQANSGRIRSRSAIALGILLAIGTIVVLVLGRAGDRGRHHRPRDDAGDAGGHDRSWPLLVACGPTAARSSRDWPRHIVHCWHLRLRDGLGWPRRRGCAA